MHNLDQKKSLNGKNFQVWFTVLIVVVGWSRYLPLSYPELFNFSPVLALFFISGVFLKGHLSWVGPVLAIFISDLFLNSNYGINLFEYFTLVSIGSYLGIFLLGKLMRNNQKPLTLFAGAISSALLFHTVTCGFAWFTNPFYPKTIGGFWQAQFFGEPGYAPAYLFLKNSILSTVLFSAIFIFSWIFLKNAEKRILLRKNPQSPPSQKNLQH